MLTDDIGAHDHTDVERACLTVVLSALQRLLVEVAVEAGNAASAEFAGGLLEFAGGIDQGAFAGLGVGFAYAVCCLPCNQIPAVCDRYAPAAEADGNPGFQYAGGGGRIYCRLTVAATVNDVFAASCGISTDDFA